MLSVECKFIYPFFLISILEVKYLDRAELKRILEKDEFIQRWLSNRNPRTVNFYKAAFKAYMEYTGMLPREMIQEASDELLKPLIERTNVVENRVKGFFTWLQKEYRQKRRGRLKGERKPKGERPYVKEKGVSASVARVYCGAIMSFYREFNYKVNVKPGRDFKALPKYPRFNWTTGDIRKLANHAKTLRDRAIILCLFQSGMDDSTLCSLNIGNIRRELQEGKIPLRLDLRRRKEGLPYITFLAKDAVEALKAYLKERERKEKRRFEEFRDDEPLFVVESWKRTKLERIKPRHIQTMFRNLAIETGLVTEEYLEKNHWNPARSHALRSAFASLLRSKGVNEEDINFMLGHKIPYQSAYYQREGERLRKTYADVMDVLSVYETQESISEVEAKLTAKIQEQNKIISNLVARNEELEGKFNKLEQKVRELLKEISIDKAIEVSILETIKEGGSPEDVKRKLESRLSRLELTGSELLKEAEER